MKKSEEYCSDIQYVVSIKEYTAYLRLHFTRNHEDLYVISKVSIRRIQDLLYTKILEDVKRGPYSKKTLDTPPKFEDNDNFELKGWFLKELRDNTFSGSDHEDAYEHIEKVLEILDLFHIPDITEEQIMLRAFLIKWRRSITFSKNQMKVTLCRAWKRFKELLMKCPQHYLTEMHEVILFYKGLEVLTRQILNSKGAIPNKTTTDAKVAIQEMAEYSQKWHNVTTKARSTKTSDGLAAIQAQLNNLGR
ncbi:hypothetical protein Tco_0750269 [Tanacetum coccineum]|uniref:Uncharacterized protein n=1 Tax=Tanacetum coccineum TaxID=301880 RepID=A0ABQ4Z0S8_9ASTR